MSGKIDVYSLYGAHYYAQCDKCGYTVGVNETINDKSLDLAGVRMEVRKHVRKTAHTVILSAEKLTYYEWEDDKE